MAWVDGADAALRALAEALLQHEGDALVVLRAVRDADGEITDFVHEVANATAERNAGKPLLGRLQNEVYPDLDASMFRTYLQVVDTGEPVSAEVEVTADDPATHGRTYLIYARRAGTERVVCQFRDITDLRTAQLALREQALHDSLTGLPNRRLLLDHMNQALARLPRRRSHLAVLFCDLDDFKSVNDTLGHPAGDELLRQVAQRLKAAVRPEDTVARLGGDEFVVLSEGLADVADAVALAERLRSAVTGAYRIGRADVNVAVSIGLISTSDPVPVEQLLADADADLYARKRRPGAVRRGVRRL